MLDKLISLNPWIEVFVKWLYWRSSGLRKILQPILKKLRRTRPLDSGKLEDFEQLKSLFKEFEISKNDILLIHSNFTDLQLGATSAEVLLDYLLKQVVPQGTLVLPAMPIMKNLDGSIAEYPGDPDSVVIFDMEKSPPWTGLLPRKLMRYSGAIRWFNPINNVVAYGHHAKEMLPSNFLDKNLSELFPSGEGSPWEYMVKRNAKILSLGTDLVHSLTMIHYVEDTKGKCWPIHGWFRKRKFIIRAEGKSHEVELNERDPRWATNFAERTLRKDLIHAGLMKSKRFNGAKIELLESGNLVRFLNSKNAKGYPYFTLRSKL